MKEKFNESLIILIFFSSLNFININSKIIAEGYHFFDLFYYRDLYNNLISQKKDNQCSIEDGPSCYYIKGKDKDIISSELKPIYPDKENFLKDLMKKCRFTKNTSKNKRSNIFNSGKRH